MSTAPRQEMGSPQDTHLPGPGILIRDTHVDGFVTDENDRVVGHEAFPDGWAVQAEQDAEFLLAKLHAVDLRIEVLKREKAGHVAAIQESITRVEEHYAKLVEVENKKRRWLIYQFWPTVEAWAKRQIAMLKKSKTLDLLFGKINSRKVPGGTSIRSDVAQKMTTFGHDAGKQPALIAWAEEACPGALKHETSFMISLLPKGTKIPGEYVTVKPDDEIITIDTQFTKITAYDRAIIEVELQKEESDAGQSTDG